jgi:hypothetical protein
MKKGRALVRHEEETAMNPLPNQSLETAVWRLVGPFSDPGVLKLHEGRLTFTIEDAGRPNLVAFYCTTALLALSVLFISLAPSMEIGVMSTLYIMDRRRKHGQDREARAPNKARLEVGPEASLRRSRPSFANYSPIKL